MSPARGNDRLGLFEGLHDVKRTLPAIIAEDETPLPPTWAILPTVGDNVAQHTLEHTSHGNPARDSAEIVGLDTTSDDAHPMWLVAGYFGNLKLIVT